MAAPGCLESSDLNNSLTPAVFLTKYNACKRFRHNEKTALLAGHCQKKPQIQTKNLTNIRKPLTHHVWHRIWFRHIKSKTGASQLSNRCGARWTSNSRFRRSTFHCHSAFKYQPVLFVTLFCPARFWISPFPYQFRVFQKSLRMRGPLYRKEPQLPDRRQAIR